MTPELEQWLLDSDPALRWQVERDLLGAPDEVWQKTRARVASEGWAAKVLAQQDPDGQWVGGAYFPPRNFDGDIIMTEHGQPWIATTWALKDLREWGLDPSVLAGTAEKLAANSRWEHEDLPYWRARSMSASMPSRWPTARQPDGTWLQGHALPGAVWVVEDAPTGQGSKWLTLQAQRVLDWWDAGT